MDFDIVFTANATSAIKILLTCLADYSRSESKDLWYGYHQDSHTSLVGGRALADTHRCFGDDREVDKWVATGSLLESNDKQLRLLAYPGQSNMTGRRLPLHWLVPKLLPRCYQRFILIQSFRRPGYLRSREKGNEVLTLMDAASLASTTALDLTRLDTSPDFVAVSFYKIFGLPDLGALVVQKRHSSLLRRRRYFGGGTVDVVTSKPYAWHALKQGCIHEVLEDGTLPFHSIIALSHAIDVHEDIYGPDPMLAISKNTMALSQELRKLLLGLRHGNGTPVVMLYGDKNTQHPSSSQGAVLALSILRADGSLVGHKEVEHRANGHNIYVRSGSLCNPGGIATYLGWDSEALRQAHDAGHSCSNPFQFVLGRPTGVVRVSLGAASVISDIHAFVRFVQQTYVVLDDQDTIEFTIRDSLVTPQDCLDTCYL